MGVKFKYKDHGMKKALKEVQKLVDDFEMAVGITGPRAQEVVSKTAEPGALAERGDGSFTLVQLAAVHEYGSIDGHIPERAPLRKGVSMNQQQIQKDIQLATTQIVTGKLPIPTALGRVTAKAVTYIQKTIIAKLLPPPNAPSTIRRKKSSTPLVDTGRFVGAITGVVRLKKK